MKGDKYNYADSAPMKSNGIVPIPSSGSHEHASKMPTRGTVIKGPFALKNVYSVIIISFNFYKILNR